MTRIRFVSIFLSMNLHTSPDATDRIDDATFISGIQFLIKENILDVPLTTEIIQGFSEEIHPELREIQNFGYKE